MVGSTAESDGAEEEPVGRTGMTATAVGVAEIVVVVVEVGPRHVLEVPQTSEEAQQPPPSDAAQLW